MPEQSEQVVTSSREDESKIVAAAIYVCAAVSIVCCYLALPYGYGLGGWASIAALVGALTFAGGSAFLFYRPRFGYTLGLMSGLVTLPWIVLTEAALYPWSNSWIALNLAPQDFPAERGFATLTTFSGLKILSTGLIVVVVVMCSLRLLPPKLALREVPLRQRTWPAFAICFIVLAVWFARSVMPYRIPGLLTRGVGSEFQILHVEKRGLHFHETRIDAGRNGHFGVWRSDRRLFQFRFENEVAEGNMPQTTYEHAKAFLKSPQLLTSRTQPAKALRSWNAEGWYVVTHDSRTLAFTTEYRSVPPEEIPDIFHEIEALPAGTVKSWPVHDICLGFCYDPLAALGFVYSNERCFVPLDGITRCQ